MRATTVEQSLRSALHAVLERGEEAYPYARAALEATTVEAAEHLTDLRRVVEVVASWLAVHPGSPQASAFRDEIEQRMRQAGLLGARLPWRQEG